MEVLWKLYRKLQHMFRQPTNNSNQNWILQALILLRVFFLNLIYHMQNVVDFVRVAVLNLYVLF